MTPTLPVEASSNPSRWRLIWRYLLYGAFIGLCAGVLEGALLFFIPRVSGLVRPDVSWIIWSMAPLVDLIAGGIVGFVLGVLASLGKRGGIASSVCAAIGAGLAGAFVAWLLNWFSIGSGVIFPSRLDPRTPVIAFVVVFVVALVLIRLVRRRRPVRAPRPLRRWVAVDAIALAILIASIVFYATHRPFSGALPRAAERVDSASSRQPNVALIVLDTVRADHLSCYGYARPTTPSICALAQHGVLFENAIAPSSWTLPSITSIFTGLLPHQTGANWGRAPGASAWTIARILSSKHYETAGFNANPYYGLGGWRLSKGFNAYEDASVSLRHNLAVTVLGQSVAKYLYDRLVRYNQFDHFDAADVNHEIIGWARHRDPSRPYFLFVNYMDAHRPYLPPALYDHRFGRIPKSLLARVIQPLNDGRPRKPFSAADRRDLIDGYDNSLAYLDHEVGLLVRFLKSEPGGSNTVFIITSDHGEGFGEHGTYDHGWNLYRDVLHVPLIIAGPGIPAGISVAATVPTRDLFSTVIDLALGLKGAVSQTSLRTAWEAASRATTANFRSSASPGAKALPQSASSHFARPAGAGTLRMNDGLALFNGSSFRGAVVSELDVYIRGIDPAALSLTTSQWHLIVNAGGSTQLYNVVRDPQERNNLAADPALHDTLVLLRQELEARLAYSLLPWRAIAYLSPLNKPGATFIQQASSSHAKFPSGGLPIGSAQAVFSHQRPSQLVQPPPAQREILRTLPYH